MISNIEDETLKDKKIMEKTVSCDYCSKELPESSILKHIGNSQACKVHYGPRFDKMKRKKNINKIKKWRKEKGKEKELKEQRELYAQDPEKKKKKKLYYQAKQAKLAKKEGWIYYPPSDSEEKDIMKENKVEKKEDSKDLDSKEVCEFCKKKFKSTVILKHIGRNQDCKSFYGNRFKELKVS